MMILASALLAGSLVATDAQARGGGGGGHGGGGAGHIARVGHDRFGVGSRHFVDRGFYEDCPLSFVWPFCDY